MMWDWVSAKNAEKSNSDEKKHGLITAKSVFALMPPPMSLNVGDNDKTLIEYIIFQSTESYKIIQ